MNRHQLSRKLLTLAAWIIAFLATGCNSDDPGYKYGDTANLAVTSFSLRTDSKITGLDSIYFSIDLNRGVIYNADSVRRGTPVDKLVPVIKFASEVESAVITMSGGTTRTGEVDYKANPTDSIDFTGDVTLTIKAKSDLSATYRIKVNVHKEAADSMIWTRMSTSSLPSRLGTPARQRTVTRRGVAYSLVKEKDGTLTLASSPDLAQGNWTKQTLSLPFLPDIDSFSASDSGFWILSTAGALLSSTDGVNWSDTGKVWTQLTGTYLDTALGISEEDGVRRFAQYPALDLVPAAVPAEFPAKGGSNVVTLQNKWTSSPVAFFAGGTTTAGNRSDRTWAFDGKEWITLSKGGIPAISGAAIVPYYNYRVSASANSMIEYEVWLLLGGLLGDGSPNRTLYISYDNGVTWQPAAASLQISQDVPPMASCDAIVMEEEKSAPLSDYWRAASLPSRLQSSVENDVISWLCPYIYLVGGTAPDGTTYDTIWRGVLSRLTFTPVI